MAYTTACTDTYSGNSNCTIYIEYQINSTSSTAHNVTFRCYARVAAATSSWNASGSSTVSFKVGSTTVKSGTWSFDFRSAGTYLIGSTTISCSSGQSVTVLASHTSGVSLGSASCSSTLTMPTISTTTYSTIREMPPNNGASDESNWTYKFTTPSSGLTCQLVMNDPNGAGDFFLKKPVTSPQTINLKTGNSIVNGLENLWAAHPNEQYVIVSMRHCTMSGNTLKKINYTDFRVNISNANPTLGNWTIRDTRAATKTKTGDTAGTSKCIVGYSTIQVDFTSVPLMKKSADFVRYEVTCGNVTKNCTAKTGTPVTFQNAPSNQVTVKVVDSRGLTTTSSPKTLEAVSYTPVSIKNLKAERQSTNTTVKLSWTKSGTPSSYSYKYRERGSTDDWTAGTTAISSTATSVTLGQTFTAGSAYDLQLTVEDGITSYTVSTVIGAYGVPLIITNTNKLVLNQESTQVINKADTRTDLLDYIYPVGSIYISNSETFDPNTAWGGTWTKIEGKFLLGADDSTYNLADTGGNSALTLRALIGAVNRLTDSIGYKSADPISGQSYTYAVRGTGQSSISTVDHATPVMDATQKTVTTNIMPPYKAVYIWERTA